MTCEINNDLRRRLAKDQFSLIGFGQGFTSGMIDRLTNRDSLQIHIFRVDGTALEDERQLGWLATMQERGTDNAGPSTKNLLDTLTQISRQIIDRGPLSMEYWEKVKSGRKECLDENALSQSEIEDLRRVLQQSSERGHELAMAGSIEFER